MKRFLIGLIAVVLAGALLAPVVLSKVLLLLGLVLLAALVVLLALFHRGVQDFQDYE